MEAWIWIAVAVCFLAREYACTRNITRMREICDKQHETIHTMSYQLTALVSTQAAKDAFDVETWQDTRSKAATAFKGENHDQLVDMMNQAAETDLPEHIL